MEKQTSFAHQRRILEQFASLLLEFETSLNGMVRKYEQEVQSLYEEQGLMQEIYNDYKTLYLDSMKSSFDDLSARISNEDIPFLEKEIDFFASR